MHQRFPGRLILAASLLLAAISFGCPDENQINLPQASSSATKTSASNMADPADSPVSAAEPATAALILLGGGVAWLIGRRRKPRPSGDLLE